MIDLKIIKEQYNNMTDGELVQFVYNDSTHLTAEAHAVLKQECYSRGLNDIIDKAERGEIVKDQEKVRRIEQMPSDLEKNVLIFSLNEKRDGKSDASIVESLLEKGLAEDDAILLVQRLGFHAQRLLKNAAGTMLTGTFVCFAGIALFLISPDKPVTTFFDIVSICAACGGIFILLTALFRYNKYKLILQNIRVAEHQDSMA